MTGLPNPHWDIDRAYGERAEDFWRALVDLPPGRVEVKHKRRHDPFLYIELQHDPRRRGVWKPSGLAVTEADFWAFAIGSSYVVILLPVDLLRWAIEQGEGRDAEETDGDNPTRGRLLLLPRLIQQSHRWMQAGGARAAAS